ncbi:MAG: HEPN domain-containing protein [Thermomicrobiales bacterium]
MAKAEENLACAESEFASGRYNSCANRCYYACYQAAIAALLRANVRPRNPDGRWGHEYVHAAFDGILIARRKLYPSSLRNVLTNTRLLRELADYKPEPVKQREVDRVLRQGREFVQAVRKAGGKHR